MVPKEGLETFWRIVSPAAPRGVAVSTTDLQARIDQWINFKSAAAAEPGANAAALHARPELGVDCVAPRNETEQTIAGIWQELLGIEPIGVHDNFFELGGQSLLATEVVARVRAQNRLAAAALFRRADCRRAGARDPAGKEWTIERKAPRIGRNSQRLNMPVKKMPRQNESAVSPVAATPTEPARTFSTEQPVFVLALPRSFSSIVSTMLGQQSADVRFTRPRAVRRGDSRRMMGAVRGGHRPAGTWRVARRRGAFFRRANRGDYQVRC